MGNNDKSVRLCRTCHYYDGPPISGEVGNCVRFPPVFIHHEVKRFQSFFDFPEVDADAWCGEWKPILVLTPLAKDS